MSSINGLFVPLARLSPELAAEAINTPGVSSSHLARQLCHCHQVADVLMAPASSHSPKTVAWEQQVQQSLLEFRALLAELPEATLSPAGRQAHARAVSLAEQIIHAPNPLSLAVSLERVVSSAVVPGK